MKPALATLLLALLPALATAGERAPKMILGWLETSQFMQSGMRIKTKLDPGARTSSMQATNIEPFTRDGEPWVRFDFTDEDLDSGAERTLRLEAPLVREVGNPVTGEEFPHIYGPLDVNAVTEVRRLR